MTVTAKYRAQDSGQTLALFAILVPGMLALMALGIDGAQIFLEKRDAQGAADLAAVSGAKMLSVSNTAAENLADEVGEANGYDKDTEVFPDASYGDATQIEVEIRTEVDTFFMPILNFFAVGDFDKLPVTARAVAQADPGQTSSGNYAVYSLMPCGEEEDFKALEWQGNQNDVFGSVHSNAGADFSGNDNGISDDFDIECTKPELNDSGKDSFTMSGSNAPPPPPGVIGSTGEPASCDGSEAAGEVCHTVVADPPYPLYDAGDINGTLCTNSDYNNDVDIDTDLAPGVYCSKKKLTIKDNVGVSGAVQANGDAGVTFIAYEIDFPGKLPDLWPNLDNTLMYAYKGVGNPIKDEVVNISGDNCSSRGELDGVVYAPYGKIKFQGNCFDVVGGLLGWRVEWSGNNNDVYGELGSSVATSPSVALIE